MAEWIETYRGVVSAWECDIVEHFTIAYYFEKFADASRNFVELIGEGEALSCPGRHRPVAPRHHVPGASFARGAAFHMMSAVTAIDETRLRIGHQVVDTTTGKTITWLAERMSAALRHHRGHAQAAGVARRRMARPGGRPSRAVASVQGSAHWSRPRQAMGGRRAPASVAFRPRAPVLGGGHAFPYLGRHDGRLHACQPSRVLHVPARCRADLRRHASASASTCTPPLLRSATPRCATCIA